MESERNKSAIKSDMKLSAKKAFSAVAMTVFGAGTIIGGIALLTGGWSTADQLGGVDLTIPGIATTFICAALAYAGYKGFESAVRTQVSRENTSTPKQNGPA